MAFTLASRTFDTLVRFTKGAALFFALGCTNKPAVQRPPSVRAAAGCSYDVRAPAGAPFAVDVDARCEGTQVTGFRTRPELARFVQVTGEGAREDGKPSAAPVREVFRARRQEPAASSLSYRVNLDAMARAFDDVDVASRFGSSLLVPASSFLLSPDPDPDGAPVDVRFDAALPFATGLRRSAGGYGIETHELRVATYTAFAARELRSVRVGETHVHLVRLDGALDLSFDELARWVEQSARAVGEFYGRAPDTDITVMLAPLPGRRGIPFGKLLPESGAGIVVLLGEHTQASDLARDWVLVHELFHVGCPSFQGEGKWFDEGLATYFEPLIRARAGLLSETEVFAEFFEAMPRGLPAFGERGLENAESYADVYWGGALFCFLADLEIRKRSGGKLGLEDGVRAVLAQGGFASEVWPLARALDAADAVFETPVLAPLAARHARAGTPVDLPAVFGDLGVTRGADGAVELDDSAPLAAVRRALFSGGRSASAAP
jgi:hypothetical protein